jgi:glycosyltransferase involved in cell wall biosynthesis
LDGLRVFAAFRAYDGIPGFRFFHPRLGGALKALRAADADIYYVRCAGYMLALVVWLSRRMGRKSVFCGANDPDFDPDGLRRRLSFRDRQMYQWGLRRVEAIVVQNREQKRLLERHYGRTAELIHNGLPVRERLTAPGRDILWVATFKRFKMPELCLELARRLPEERFVMIGGRSKNNAREAAWFDQLALRARRLPNIEFLGFQPLTRVEERFDQAKLLVNTSRHEGFPNTYLQAWSRGLPVLSFVDPDNLIEQQRLGWSVGSLDEMVQVIRELTSGARTYSSSEIKACFDRCLTIETVVDRYEQLFASLVKRDRERRSVENPAPFE